jgi:TRAP-type C4-dicarboxylate transport system permease large subunit
MPQHLELLSPPDLVRPRASHCLSIKERLYSVLVCFVIIRQVSVRFQNLAVRISNDLRFGIMMCMNLSLALMTQPLGVCLFVSMAITGGLHSLDNYVRAAVIRVL